MTVPSILHWPTIRKPSQPSIWFYTRICVRLSLLGTRKARRVYLVLLFQHGIFQEEARWRPLDEVLVNVLCQFVHSTKNRHLIGFASQETSLMQLFRSYPSPWEGCPCKVCDNVLNFPFMLTRTVWTYCATNVNQSMVVHGTPLGIAKVVASYRSSCCLWQVLSSSAHLSSLSFRLTVPGI
jgi:hypothetical protein